MTTVGTAQPPGSASAASRRASALAVVVLSLLLASRISDVLGSGQPAQVPFTVALAVLPLAYAMPATRRRAARYRWPVLVVQGVLTWVPFAVFGDRWQIGIGGLLAGLVLLTVAGRAAWLTAGALLAAEVAVRASVNGWPSAPVWYGVLQTVTFFVDDALIFFGMVRLAQVIRELEQAHSRAADVAVAGERLRAAGELRAAIGQRLAGITARAAAARRALSNDAAAARAQIAMAGITARDAVAKARAITFTDQLRSRLDPAGSLAGAVPSVWLARGVLVTVLLMYAGENIGFGISRGLAAAATAFTISNIVLVTALQSYHSLAARQGRGPRAWAVTLTAQAALVYAFAFPPAPAYVGTLAPFLAGSMLLVVPGWWRWAGYAAVVVSWPALNAALGLLGIFFPGGPPASSALYFAVNTAEVGLLVYGLARLAGLAAEMAGLRDELTRMAVAGERLRIARDVHDLLGLGLSAIALKTDLIGALIDRDNARAATEVGELVQICAAARADVQLLAAGGQKLSLRSELAAARQILSTAGIDVRADIADGQVPAVADEVLGPVLREAVTNILRHSAATACVIEASADDGTIRLRVGNDGVTLQPARVGGPGAAAAGEREGGGLANLTARVEAAGGQLTCSQADGHFDLAAEIPFPGKV